MTRTSESETQGVEAIGNGRVIPAQAGIQDDPLKRDDKFVPRPSPGRRTGSE